MLVHWKEQNKQAKRNKKLLKSCLVISVLSILSSLAGCALPPDGSLNGQSQMVAAQPIIREPQIVQVPMADKSFHLAYGNDPRLERAFNSYIRTGRAANIVSSGFEKFAYSEAAQPVIQTAPFQETVISLEPGEKITNVSTGDPQQWSYSLALSGMGADTQQHILLKPSLPDISTNMVITTDKRMYNLKLLSTLNNAKLTRTVSFWYPDEMVAKVNAQTLLQSSDNTVKALTNVDIKCLNFDYSISSGGLFSTLAWKPLRAFDDGTHTYIEFPRNITNKDMPALFVMDGKTQALVNYRVQMPYFVVDKIFKQAVLVIGVGSQQNKVTITNNRYQ
jgi:P-type conjugative transfer protein TrbG